ncbi:MAG: ferrous iron transporter B [Phycisphaerales bacterium]|nr:ferrous iron transporter B [Phycisphaerales bacterium]
MNDVPSVIGTPANPTPPTRATDAAGPLLSRVALLGNPNTGKTTLFNRLTGLTHKTSNFPGTTLDARTGRVSVPSSDQEVTIDLIDLPGVYSLELRQPEADVARAVLNGELAPAGLTAQVPDALLIVLDATNLGRNLVMVGEALRRRLPTVVAVNMIDLAEKRALRVDTGALSAELGCPVMAISARSGRGLPELINTLARTLRTEAVPTRTAPGTDAQLRQWAERTVIKATSGPSESIGHTFSDRADLVLTHPLSGVLVFALVMTGLFGAIFTAAQYPMGWIEQLFANLGGGVDWIWATAGWEPGLLHDLLKDGVIAGVGSTVVFLPQICLLFFLISLLEDTGYLARAAFVMDRALRPFGLPGHAFVPLLSSHACALPGIMSARSIPDSRERLATILVAPFMTCSARLPVYVLLTGLLFKDSPWLAAAAFVGCYALGILAGVFSALLARRTILRGSTRPMALELPSYKLPSLRNALSTTIDRGMVFIKKAGTAILAICIILWWLGSFPKVDAPTQAVELRQSVAGLADDSAVPTIGEAAINGPGEPTTAADVRARADRIEHAHAKSSSFMGMLGRTAQPAFAPLGYDWQLTVGVIASFAAREVFVSTMSVVIAGEEEGDDEARNQTLRQELATATRGDGITPIFNPATCWSLLVFYVLAMQCLPTLVVTAREAGHAKWALLQLVWMTLVAYLGALAAYHIASSLLS